MHHSFGLFSFPIINQSVLSFTSFVNIFLYALQFSLSLFSVFVSFSRSSLHPIPFFSSFVSFSEVDSSSGAVVLSTPVLVHGDVRVVVCHLRQFPSNQKRMAVEEKCIQKKRVDRI